jgi:hypothetical protein
MGHSGSGRFSEKEAEGSMTCPVGKLGLEETKKSGTPLEDSSDLHLGPGVLYNALSFESIMDQRDQRDQRKATSRPNARNLS